MPYYYGFDWTYIILVLPCLILSLWASSSVTSTFKRYSTQSAMRALQVLRLRSVFLLTMVSVVFVLNGFPVT